MPLYTYQCKYCDEIFEDVERTIAEYSENPSIVCPNCGKIIERSKPVTIVPNHETWRQNFARPEQVSDFPDRKDTKYNPTLRGVEIR